MFLAVAFIVAAQITIASSQTSPEIERLTAAIAKTPEDELLYIERGRLYTWNDKWIGPNVAFQDIGKTIDENRAKALADADKAVKVNSLSYKAYVFRAFIVGKVGSYFGRSVSKEDLETAAKLRNNSNIVANILKFDLAGQTMINPPYTTSVPVLNVIVKDEQIGLVDGFDSVQKAKEFAEKGKVPKVIMFNRSTNKHFLYEAFVVENIYPNVQLAETPFRKVLNGKIKLPLTYETLKIDAQYSVQPIPKDASLDDEKLPWQFVDVIDTNGLTLLKDPKISLLNGSKGVRLLFDGELAKGNFDEAVAIYNWLAKINAQSLDLDIVKITRKTNLSKIYQYAEKLRPFVEKEMTKWNYAEGDKDAVRGTIKK